MNSGFIEPLPLFVGPVGFLVGTLLIILLVLLLARVVFGLAWKLVEGVIEQFSYQRAG